MKVVVGTKNPAKVKGVERAFKKFFEEVEVLAKAVSSGVSQQPFDDETVVGAINRAKNSYSDEFDFSVGIEAGLFRVKNSLTGFVDFQVACIYNGEKFTLGFGPGFEYPKRVIDEVLKGREVGDVMDEISGVKNLGEKMGAIGFLTKKRVERSDLTEIAVTMALIPWINTELYEI